jgi:hypothetical protein
LDKCFKPQKDGIVITIKLLPVFASVISLLIFKSTTTALSLLVPGYFTIFQLLRSNYKVTAEGYLIVRYGMQNLKININDITDVVLNKSLSIDGWFRTYALSSGGLTLKYGRDAEIIISPEDQGTFISCLQTANSRLAKIDLP